ncbi:MAG TPA: protease pro-enzyme activation domain-containing protein [Nitrospira sp.]|nr:protease pro-enzyme activation domain-containing protein [Nitrospira sp.]
MPTNHNRVTVRGSERSPHHAARVDGPVPNDERFEVTVRIRRKTALQSPVGGFHTDKLPMNRRYLTREEYASSHGADSADMAKVEAFARAHNLVVVETSSARRSIFLSGTAADFARAFGTTIEHYEHDGGTYRGRVGPLTVPAELGEIVEGVFGIDDRPVAKPHFQRRKMPDDRQPRATGGSFTPVELATLYNFPIDLDGSGQCIAIIVLPSSNSAAAIARPTSRRIFKSSVGPRQRSKRFGSMAEGTTPPTPRVPTGRSCSTSKWRPPWRRRR